MTMTITACPSGIAPMRAAWITRLGGRAGCTATIAKGPIWRVICIASWKPWRLSRESWASPTTREAFKPMRPRWPRRSTPSFGMTRMVSITIATKRPGRRSGSNRWSGFLPLWAGIASPEQARRLVREHLTEPKRNSGSNTRSRLMPPPSQTTIRAADMRMQLARHKLDSD